MATKHHKTRGKKTTLALLRSKLTYGVKMIQKREGKTDDRYSPQEVPAPLKVEKVKEWLGCSAANVRDIESAKVGRAKQGGGYVIRRLTPEQADIISYQTGVSRAWLLEGDLSKPIVNWRGQPYTQADFDQRQKDIASGKASFTHPQTLLDVSRPRDWLSAYVAMIIAILLRGLRRGQADIYNIKLRRSLRNFYGEPLPGEDRYEWSDLINKALYHGSPTLTRPDLGPLLDEWDARFKTIAQARNSKLPLAFPQPSFKVFPCSQQQSRPIKRPARGKAARRK